MTKDKRILIADDDPRVLLVLRATLERMKNGYGIFEARDGSEALREIRAQPFDLVITDVRMPGINGIELVEAIRAMNSRTAVIWITAYGCHRLRSEGERLDVYCCLDKPLRIGQIRAAALEALASHSGPERTDE